MSEFKNQELAEALGGESQSSEGVIPEEKASTTEDGEESKPKADSAAQQREKQIQSVLSKVLKGEKDIDSIEHKWLKDEVSQRIPSQKVSVGEVDIDALVQSKIQDAESVRRYRDLLKQLKDMQLTDSQRQLVLEMDRDLTPSTKDTVADKVKRLKTIMRVLEVSSQSERKKVTLPHAGVAPDTGSFDGDSKEDLFKKFLKHKV